MQLKLNKGLLLLVLLQAMVPLKAQHLFPEKYTECITDRFGLESDSIRAKIETTELIRVVVSGFDDKTKNKIRGVLTLQIIVDLQGKSCLISAKNNTNIKTKKLNLKETVDNSLFWKPAEEKVAAIVVLKFEENGIQMMRLGMNAKKGVHELRE